MNDNKLRLTAAILNSEKEIEIFDWLHLTAPEYTGQFNKRFETWLDKQSRERFGTRVLKAWGLNGEDKTVPNVTFYLRKDDYQLTSVTKFELSINYTGHEAGYDYDNKKLVLREHNENEKLFGVSGTADITAFSENIVANRREGIEKMQDNLRRLPELHAKHDKLLADIEDFNTSISWAISDQLRIRR